MEIDTLLIREVVHALKRQGLMLATAESCTGGWVAQVITSVAGSSEWFERGFVAYTNLAKREMLGVSTTILSRHGAVSEQCARAMAEGALTHSHAQVALAITGVAGVCRHRGCEHAGRAVRREPCAPLVGRHSAAHIRRLRDYSRRQDAVGFIIRASNKMKWTGLTGFFRIYRIKDFRDKKSC